MKILGILLALLLTACVATEPLAAPIDVNRGEILRTETVECSGLPIEQTVLELEQNVYVVLFYNPNTRRAILVRFNDRYQPKTVTFGSLQDGKLVVLMILPIAEVQARYPTACDYLTLKEV
jgi:hypothetical protein